MSQNNIVWHKDAEARLKRAPFFIRPFVKARVEKVARSRNILEINEDLIVEIKQNEMPK